MLGKNFLYTTQDPFPIGAVEPALDHFHDFRFPDLTDFVDVTREYPGNWAKKLHLWSYHPRFHEVIQGTPWADFWKWLNTPDFIEHCRYLCRPFGMHIDGQKPLMQFSSLPYNGGWIHPHTDQPEKVLSIVIFMEGHPAPFKAHKGDVITEFPVAPNRYIFFKRSDTSVHSVGPFFDPQKRNRNTVNINLLYKPMAGMA